MRGLFLLFLLTAHIFAAGVNWQKTEKFSLKKDRIALWKSGQRELTFRWTLFHNRGLVYLAKFDKFPYQGILYDDYRLNGVKVKLAVSKIANIEDPYCMIVFNGYNAESKSADFTLYLKDERGITKLQRLK